MEVKQGVRRTLAVMMSAVAVGVVGCGGVEEGLEVESGLELATGTSQEPLYVASTLLWANPVIPVCWETAGSAIEKGWTRDAVLRTWEQQSGVTFTGWGDCPPGSTGIRIRINDEASHTKGLGTQLNGAAAGMVLNFTYNNNWSPRCRSSESMREHCIRSFAVHEFGHALAFAHEHNRPDTPSTCTYAPQGGYGDTTVGAWDLTSVMNYCNPTANNAGNLSATDIDGSRRMYGFDGWSRETNWCGHGFGQLLTGDFNGDGRADLLCSDTSNGYKWIDYADGAGQFWGTDWEADARWCYGADWRLYTGDFNGDRRTDLFCHNFRNGEMRIDYADSLGRLLGTDWYRATNWCGHSVGQLHMGDFNGDGRADLLCSDTSNGDKWIDYADGAGQFWGTDWQRESRWCFGSSSARLHLGDFNGDGRSDLLCTDNGYKWIDYADGAGQFWGTDWQRDMGWCHTGNHLRLADFNGDGRTDMLCHNPSDGHKWFSFANAWGSFDGTSWDGRFSRWCAAPSQEVHVGRFNGDTKADMLCHDRVTGNKWVSYLPL
jgi:hypothetical protein